MGPAPIRRASDEIPVPLAMKYVREIDGLRGLAILVVVLFHAYIPGFGGGFLGVDVFFVISGFLITGILVEEFERTGRISISGFYERRIRRLFPALSVVLIATSALALVVLKPVVGELQDFAAATVAVLAFGGNFYFHVKTGGYFGAPAEEQPLLHTWSLAVEEQFYLVWPLLLLIVGRFALGRGWRLRRSLLLFAGISTAASFAFCLWLTYFDRSWAFYLAPSRAWELGVGAVIFMAGRRMDGRWPRWSSPVGLALFVLSLWLIRPSSPFPGFVAVAPVAASGLLVIGAIARGPGNKLQPLLRSRYLVSLGLISYPLYLWHWPLLSFARIHLLGSVPLVARVALCALAVALAWLTYRYMETPVREGRVACMRDRTATIRTGLVSILLLSAVAGALQVWADHRRRTDPQVRELAAAFDRVVRYGGPCRNRLPYDGKLLDRGDCVLPDGADSSRVGLVLWGDSHAGHLAPAMGALAERFGFTSLVRYALECPPIASFEPAEVGIEVSRGCSRFNEDVLSEIESLSHDRRLLVVVSARWLNYGSEFEDSVYRERLLQTVERLREIPVDLAVVGPGIDLPHWAPICLARRSERACSTPAARSLQLNREFAELFDGTGVPVISPPAALCVGDECPVYDGEVLYSDDDHLTREGALRFVPLLEEALGLGRPELDSSLNTG